MGIFLRIRAVHYSSVFVKIHTTDRLYCRVAVVVSKKTAPRSVDRSHLKRVAYHQLAPYLDVLSGFDMVITVKKGDEQSIVQDIEEVVSRLRSNK